MLVLNLMRPIPLAKADATQRAGQQAQIFAAEPSEISLWLIGADQFVISWPFRNIMSFEGESHATSRT